MRLYSLRYLFYLILEGEKTNVELSQDVGGSASNISHALNFLQNYGLIRHPGKRPRSWDVNHAKELIPILEKLLLVTKNNPKIISLLLLPSVIKIGTSLTKKDKGLSIATIVKTTHFSKITVIKVLDQMVSLNIIRKKTGKPNIYYVSDTMLSRLFITACSEIEKSIVSRNEKDISPQEIIRQLKNDKSVLILIHYGSSSRGKADNLSDIDILAVTRDKISRGDILDRYAHKKLDLNIYSKSGFLQLIKTQPDFIRNISTARILKGEDILKAILQ